MATLVLRRDRTWFGLLVPYRVDVGVRKVARLWAGQSVEVETESGPQVVTVWSGKIRIGVETVAVDPDATSYLITHAPQAVWKSALGLGRRPITLRRIAGR